MEFVAAFVIYPALMLHPGRGPWAKGYQLTSLRPEGRALRAGCSLPDFLSHRPEASFSDPNSPN